MRWLLIVAILCGLAQGQMLQQITNDVHHAGGGSTPTVTLLCSQAFGTTCTSGSSVSVGQCVVIVMGSEGDTHTTTWGDSNSNTYAQDAGGYSATPNLTFFFYHTRVTTPITTSTVFTANANETFHVYSDSICNASPVGVGVNSTTVSGTSWTIGPTSSTTSTALCFGGGMAGNAVATAGSGWTLLNQINNTDNRILADESQLYGSGVTTGGTGTLTWASSQAGDGAVQCYYYP